MAARIQLARLLKNAVVVSYSTILTSCVLTQTHLGCCRFHGDLSAAKTDIISRVVCRDASLAYQGNQPVFVARPRGVEQNSPPPVLLLHEMPGLSPDTLQFADCIAQHGYTVYVPLLFGTLDENTDSSRLFLRRSLSFKFSDPLWKDVYHVSTRLKAVGPIKNLASRILKR